jgi:hypothetical protein
MSTQHANPESGLRKHRTEFVREPEFGATPDDPDFQLYSTTTTQVSWASDSINEPRRGLGDADPKSFEKGPESHELTVAYDLCKWFTDGNGNPNDAAYDGLVRDADSLLPNSHTVVDREDKGGIVAEATVSGNASYGTRLYTVVRGALLDEVAVIGDPSDSQPVTVEATYVAQYARSFQIDQPDSGTLLVVASDDGGDTGQTLTIEDEGADTTEQIALDGTNAVSTSQQFSDIDALELSGETAGDVTVSINAGSESSPTVGDDLAVLRGAASYNDVGGDIGVPALGAGSHEDPSSVPAPETFIGDTIARGGSPVPYEVATMTVTVANNVEQTERAADYGMHLAPGPKETTAEASVFGDAATHGLLVDHLTNTARDIEWTLRGGTLQLTGAVLNEPGERAAEEGQAVMTTDNTFMADGTSFA